MTERRRAREPKKDGGAYRKPGSGDGDSDARQEVRRVKMVTDLA